MKSETGWFGQVGRRGRSTLVHVLKEDGTCLCGYKAHTSYLFQWCAHGICLKYIDCTTCVNKSEKILQIYDKEKYNEHLHRKTIKYRRK